MRNVPKQVDRHALGETALVRHILSLDEEGSYWFPSTVEKKTGRLVPMYAFADMKDQLEKSRFVNRACVQFTLGQINHILAGGT